MVSWAQMWPRVDTYVTFGSGCAVVDHDALGFDIEELLHDDEKSREAFYAHDESFDQFALCLRSGGRREDNRHLHHRILML